MEGIDGIPIWVRLWARLKMRTPCWLTGHAEVPHPFENPQGQWCMKCDRGWRLGA
jgi:hypothetical protein